MLSPDTIEYILQPLREGARQVASICITATADPAKPLQLVITDTAGAEVIAVPLTLDEGRGLRDEWIAAVAAAEAAGS